MAPSRMLADDPSRLERAESVAHIVRRTQRMPEPRSPAGDTTRTPRRAAQASTGRVQGLEVLGDASECPLESSRPSDAFIPAKSWYGSVISSNRRASPRRVSSYWVSRVKSSVPSNAIQPVTDGRQLAHQLPAHVHEA